MIPERIGIIGRIQGVNAKSNPKPKNVAAMSQIELFAIVAAILSCSGCRVVSELEALEAVFSSSIAEAGKILTSTLCFVGG